MWRVQRKETEMIATEELFSAMLSDMALQYLSIDTCNISQRGLIVYNADGLWLGAWAYNYYIDKF